MVISFILLILWYTRKYSSVVCWKFCFGKNLIVKKDFHWNSAQVRLKK